MFPSFPPQHKDQMGKGRELKRDLFPQMSKCAFNTFLRSFKGVGTIFTHFFVVYLTGGKLENLYLHLKQRCFVAK